MAVKENQLNTPFFPADRAKLDGIQTAAEANPPIASQAVAQAGVDNFQYMTALRVKQAIDVFASSSGESNTMANVGTGVGVYKEKSGVQFRMRTLEAGDNIDIALEGDNIVISSTASGGAEISIEDEGVEVDGLVSTINFTGAGVSVTQTAPGAVEVAISTGESSGHLTQWVEFDSGRVKVLATGTAEDLAAITATKNFDVSAVSRLILNRPTSVQYRHIMVQFTAGETAGRTEIRVEMPEPSGETDIALAFRPIGFRLTASEGVGATGGTVSMDGTTYKVAMTGYTAGQVQRMVVLI